ncbi:hypothetical protein [Limnobacter sp.]|uniref:hypothetical protein n=1 Tax=Limnobacter sp. TaxID=2003368 RepID=UPI002732D210|nr:hypothetical protein [Limnobacter sp.]MDP3272467.1 hypothetical protein [Limnobacter sp.]
MQANTTAPNKPKGGALSRLAAMWCEDPHFQNWIMASDPASARKKILLKCGITSRSELDHSRTAAEHFHTLIRQPYSAALKREGK